MNKKKIGIVGLLLAAVLFSGCGSAASYDSAAIDSASGGEKASYESAVSTSASSGLADSAYDTAETNESAAATAEESGTDAQTGNLDDMTLLEEKLVYHCDMEIETLEYADTLQAVKDTIEKYDGIIQSENETDSSYGWYYEDYRKTNGTLNNYLQVRVPSGNYQSFIEELNGVGKVISRSTSIENISQKYYDTAVEIEALELQEKNLLAMMERCETIEDMIAVQDRLTEVQYQLNLLKTDLHYMDVDVAYSYVNIQIEEVMEYRSDTPVKTNTFFDRFKNTLVDTWEGFLDFLEGLLFLVIHLIPYILLGILLWFVFRKPIGRWREKRREKKERKQAERNQKKEKEHTNDRAQ